MTSNLIWPAVAFRLLGFETEILKHMIQGTRDSFSVSLYDLEIIYFNEQLFACDKEKWIVKRRRNEAIHIVFVFYTVGVK